MAEISQDELRKEIAAILKDANLKTLSAKKVRQQIEEKLNINLTERKKEVDDLVMENLRQQQEQGNKEEEDAEEEEEEEEELSAEEEKEKKPAKRGRPKKAPTAKRKKTSSDEEESASDDDTSDEEYNPKKPAGKAAKKGKKKGSDSDSDEDWGKTKKTGTAKKGTKKRKDGRGYTRPLKLSPELAAVVGADQMARHEVVKKVWSIIKERDLYDPKSKQFAICDDDLFKVIGKKRFRTFGMMKYLKHHFVD